MRPVEAELSRAKGRTDGRTDRQTDTTKLIVGFRNLANGIKNGSYVLNSIQTFFYVPHN